MTMTPLMRQYWDIKSLHQDKILLFRMGDFFEMFFDDAVKVAPILGIALTSRNKKSNDETPMCGFPHHSMAGPINKLLSCGLRVAICDQIEDPKLAKGIVKRAVTRILTPGMVYDTDLIAPTQNHYIASVSSEDISFVDSSTGESFFFRNVSLQEQQRLLGTLPVAEIVLASGFEFTEKKILISHHDSLLNEENSNQNLPPSAQRLISYIHFLGGKESLRTLKSFEEKSLQQRLELSPTVLRHLEIFATYKGEGTGSLFSAINRTQTSSGARLLRQWLAFPLTSKEEIIRRQELVMEWMKDVGRLKKLRDILASQGDIERRLGKISQTQCNARDLQSLSHSIRLGIEALIFSGKESGAFEESGSFSILKSLALEIDSTLVEEPPLQVRQGHLIRKGYSSELDELIALSQDSQFLLNQMESAEKEKTGISSLKIRYNNVFGYYIEITHTHKDKVPSHYMRKQTLSNAERYCTDELVELEKKVLTAQSKREDLEFEIFEKLREKALVNAPTLLSLASACSELDVITSLSWLALERKYTKPQFVEAGIFLKASRHPVVEQTVAKNFVANDIKIGDIDQKQSGCLLLTGPNMAGKSTLMRQVALTVILGQMGGFVPADRAQLPIFDHIFTRIGASDQLSEGLSTFMVEMTETSEMLAKSNRRSLVVLDEIGRGTSTFDGMSLAQAILEFLLTEVHATTLFATHYHELTKLEKMYPLLQNAHMTVSEKSGEIRFLHTLTCGPAQKSYGIQVAKLAGLPSKVTNRAQILLKETESRQRSASGFASGSASGSSFEQLSLLDYDATSAKNEFLENKLLEKMVDEIKKFSVSNKTPLEAIMKIAQWQETLSSTNNH